MHQRWRPAAKNLKPLIFIVSCLLFSWHLGRPTTLNFDETGYVPPARDLLRGVTISNLEHPPFAKYVMAIGIDLAGDNPLGWRMMSVLFGALTMVAVVALAEAFEFNCAEQWMIAILTLTNCMLFIMARICMLDVFMLFFSYAAMASFCHVWRDTNKSTRAWIYCGLSMGLAIACKWSALFCWLPMFALSVGRMVHFARPKNTSGIIAASQLFMSIAILPIIAYYVAFLPLYVIGHRDLPTPAAFWEVQKGMYLLQTRLLKPHGYASQWYTWPFLYRPVWFKFEKLASVIGDWDQTVLFIGNPWLAWFGIFALIFCFYDYFRRKTSTSGLIAVFFGCSYFCWSIPSRPVQFLYYYLPAYMMLGFACVFALRNWPRTRIVFVTINVLFFVYFYPVISGGPIPFPNYGHWMWFQSWR